MAFRPVNVWIQFFNHSRSPAEPLPAIGVDFSILKLYIKLPGLRESDHIRARVYCEVKGIWCVMDVIRQWGESGS